MTAFVDESIRLGPSGFYIVAAIVVVGDLDRGREFARSLLLPSQLRLHWNEEIGRHTAASGSVTFQSSGA